MTYTIQKPWKEFNLDLEAVKIYFSQCSEFCGISANSQIEFHFTSIPSAAYLAAFEAYYEGLTAESPEALSYKSQAEIATKVQELKLDAAAKSWDSLNIAQRKLILGAMPSKDELFAVEPEADPEVPPQA